MTITTPWHRPPVRPTHGASSYIMPARAALLLFLFGCIAPPVADPAGPAPYLGSCEDSLPPRRDLDVLFVIDNSAGMSTKQSALVQAVPGFIRALEEQEINYHIGVVTTDVGANPTTTSTFPGNRTLPGCASFSGDDGRLQNLPCSDRSGVSAAAASACASLCPDSRYVPTGGRYIERKGSTYNVPSKRDAQGREIGPQEAFRCMALVGDAGCGIESPLEAAKRALDGHLNENSGFLRINSVLAVLFVTDEDDCSVQISQRLTQLDPMTTNCTGNMSPSAPGACFNPDFRCLARNIECADDSGAYQPMTVAGPKKNCREKPNNSLIPIKNYQNFFRALRPAHKLVLAGILTPSLLDAQSGTEIGKLVVEQDPAGEPGTPGLVRGYQARAACFNPSVPVPPEEASRGFIGQAQLRLSSFLRGFDSNTRSESSICEPEGFAAALAGVTAQLTQALQPFSCLGSASHFVLDAEGRAQCQVGPPGGAGGRPASTLPRCGAVCCKAWSSAARPIPTDPNIAAACAPEPADCYCVEENASCFGLAGGVWRRGGSASLPAKPDCFSCLMQPPTGSLLR